MRVLVRVNELGLGGTQLNAIDFAIAARAHGVHSTIVGYRETLPPQGPSLLDVASDRGLPIEILDEIPFGGLRGRLQRMQDLRQLADRHNVDLVHAYGAWSARRAYWGPCRFGRRPIVITVYEMYLPSHVYRRPHLIVGTTHMYEVYEPTRGNVHLISPPVDVNRDAPGVGLDDLPQALVNPTGNLRLVIVTRLDDRMKAHGISLTMRAVQRLNRGDVDLVIVGGGPAEERLRAEADAANERLGRRAIVMTGPMADPRPAYSSADVMLGMGGSAARSLAFGKPLVAVGEHGWSRRFTPESAREIFRDSFWSEEVIEDGESHLLKELDPLLTSAAERLRLGQFGRRFAEENYGLEAMTDRLVSVYRMAVSSYGPLEWLRDLPTEAGNACAATWRRVRAGQ
jgi:glycosyltransferase involved in cell wall biosynthesis